MRRYALMLALLLAACGETGQERLSVAVAARGGPATFTAGLWDVTLSEALVAVGPIYWCATAAASADLCPAATFELTQSATVDGLAPDAQLIGTADGVTGEVRSAVYDYGISWLATQNQPTPTSGSVDGSSARFAGVATTTGRSLAFTAVIDITPQLQGTYAVQGARAAATIAPSTTSLTLTARPDLWFAAVDFDAAAPADATSVEITSDSVAGNTVRIGMTANVPLTFTWE
ncbi:MAG: hypothetical protein ACAI38_03060 [Myxococcota bacterium]|nr:hypothetical protein [Myxococcota bacterium]